MQCIIKGKPDIIVDDEKICCGDQCFEINSLIAFADKGILFNKSLYMATMDKEDEFKYDRSERKKGEALEIELRGTVNDNIIKQTSLIKDADGFLQYVKKCHLVSFDEKDDKAVKGYQTLTGLLEQDEQPLIYFYDQFFHHATFGGKNNLGECLFSGNGRDMFCGWAMVTDKRFVVMDEAANKIRQIKKEEMKGCGYGSNNGVSRLGVIISETEENGTIIFEMHWLGLLADPVIRALLCIVPKQQQ